MHFYFTISIGTFYFEAMFLPLPEFSKNNFSMISDFKNGKNVLLKILKMNPIPWSFDSVNLIKIWTEEFDWLTLKLLKTKHSLIL